MSIFHGRPLYFLGNLLADFEIVVLQDLIPQLLQPLPPSTCQILTRKSAASPYRRETYIFKGVPLFFTSPIATAEIKTPETPVIGSVAWE
jgi:hypothetical protein